MLQNYLTVALRNLSRHKLYAAINIVGLAIGLAACTLIFLYVRDELSWDRSFKDAERIQRLEITFSPPGRAKMEFAQGTGRVKDGFLGEFPEIEALTRFMYAGAGSTVRRDDRIFNENLMFADPNVFEMFSVRFIAGDSATALQDTNSVVLSAEAAGKYFGDEDPLGRTLTISSPLGARDFRVVGVFEDLPYNAHMDMDVVVRFNDDDFAAEPNISRRWMASNMYVYFLLREGVSPDTLRARFPDFIDRNATPEIREFGVPLESATDMTTWNLVALTDIHLHGAPQGAIKPRGSLTNILSFSAVAVLLLAIAIVNFSNLATARSTTRAKEIGLRKLVGASRGQLIRQFLGEAILTAVAAVLLSLAMVEVTLPFYNEFLGREISLQLGTSPGHLLAYAGFALAVGVAAGMYPAFFLTRPMPGKVLHSNQSGSSGSILGRNILVVLQYAGSIALVASTMIVFSQTRYAQSIDTGFRTEGVVILRGLNDPAVYPDARSIKTAMQTIDGINSASLSAWIPTRPQGGGTRATISFEDQSNTVILGMQQSDYNLFETYGIEAVAGRLPNEAFGTDKMRGQSGSVIDGGVLINERAVRQFGFSSNEDAIGRSFQMIPDSENPANTKMGTIIGVIPDLIVRSVRDEIAPMVYFVDEQYYQLLSLHIDTENLPVLMRQIEQTWESIVPGTPLQIEFIDENIAAQYEGERTAGVMFSLFAILALIVSSLGLYGMATFAAERRTKEIGIRKVLGARVRDIVGLLIWQFSKPVLVASLLAWPIAAWAMHSWLSSFVYRIDLSVMPFVIASVFTVLLAWATIATRALRVAGTRPVQALRYE